MVSTAASPGAVPAGTIVNDTANFTGDFSPGIGGTVTYQRYSGTGCTGTVATSQTVSVGAAGAIPASAAFTVGTTPVAFDAVYNGDTSDHAVTSACEPFGVISISTIASPNSELSGGGTLSDSATLTGGDSPTGTVTFYLFSPTETCSTTPAAGSYVYTSGAVSVGLDGNYHSGTGPNPDAVGTWEWLAVYSGDSNNAGTNSGCTAEPVTVTQASPGINTTATPANEVVGGGTLSDWATLTGGDSPTGTVTFYLFSPTETCSTTPAAGSYVYTSGAVSVGLDGNYHSGTGPNPDAVGTWEWLAVYSGDSNNAGTNSGCTAEPVTVTQASPGINTTATPANEVVGGGTLSDSATLTGGDSPTGTVTFYLFSPTETCSTTPAAGSYVYTSGAVSVGLDGNYHSGTGPNPDAVGTWEWLAVYSGDSNNAGTNSGCTAEPVTVTQASPGINTTATPANEVVGGGTLSDSATLTGGDSPTGTVTFYLFSPTETCSTTPAAGSYVYTSGAVSVGLDGNYHSGTGPNPDAVGTWEWLAVYSGDSNNAGTNSGCTAEPVTVTQASPGINTTATPANEVVGGGTLSDSATLTGGDSPTGTVTFYLFSPTETCSTTPAAGSVYTSGAVSVGLDGNYHSGTGPNPDAVGTWEWLAVYSGDANNDGTNSGCTAEPVTVTQASPGINTTATPANEVVGGGTLSDSATLTGGDSPTGTVTFYLFSPTETCSTTPAAGSYVYTSGAVSVGLDGNYHSGTGPNPDAVGTWEWLAVYSGDSNNAGTNSGCTAEPVTVTQASPGINTTATPANEVVGGGTLSDSATLTGGDSPTGTVTFYLFSPTETCSTTPAAGSYVYTSGAVSVGLDGNYHSGTGPNPDAVGTWEWLAVYSGDSNNDGTNSGCSAEPVTVTQASPGINTTATPANEVVGGGTLSDSATLTGGDSPTGTVTFYLFSPTETCSTTPAAGSYVYTSGAVSVGLDGNYHSGTGPNPDAVGTWEWLAVYSGDANNDGTNSGCTAEPVTVTQTSPGINTTATPANEVVGGGTLSDSATLTGGDSPTGTVTFYLFSPTETCSTTPAAGSDVYTSGAVSVGLDGNYHSGTGPNPDAVGTWEWLAVYSGDANNDGTNSGCTAEPVTVTQA